MTAPTKDGVYRDFPIDWYHADRGSLSASAAKLLLSSPAKYRWRLDNPPEPKPYFEVGSAVHWLLLGQGNEIEIIDAEDWRSKIAREQRDKAREAGRIPMLGRDHREAVLMRDAVRGHRFAGGLFADGEAEVSLYATDPATGVRLRARPDWMTQRDGRLWLVDLKTCANADPRDFGRTAYMFGYHLQMAWYVTVARLLELDPAPVFVFVLVEKEPPYLVSVVELDGEAFALGCRQMRLAIDTYRACSEWDEWPGYGDGIEPVSLPPWVFR
ncbi:PD-(D/E)XK nuclease-like domain-containing protein [Mycobacterium heckeshornense]|uniref:PD-(D/E)XK nuclease-like domain-containing protein n=1 Tax=Mycobacterium heckeshornense TaxID=110505 RepID=UPI00066233AA|nr:PD-(D/E)XK nuclease-like domain-containing protein [Mycobacterium heckeshornense]